MTNEQERIDHLAMNPEYHKIAQRKKDIYCRAAMSEANSLAANVPAGYKLVPIEPTEEILRALTDPFIAINGDNRKAFAKAWAAMLAAAPACTCPSGDGSLRWPCPEHPAPAPEADTNEPLFTAEEVHAYCKRAREEERRKLLEAQVQRPMLGASGAALAAKVPADALATAIACLDRFARTNEDMDALAALRELTATPAPAPEADPCLVLWKAMNQAGKVGNRTDDKLIVKFLRDAGYRIAPAPAPEAEPVAWRYKYKFRDIGETGAYEYHSHDFACVARLPKGEPLYTHPPEAKAKPEAQQADEIGPSAIFEMADKYWYRRGGVSNFDTVGFAKELLRMRGIGASGEAT